MQPGTIEGFGGLIQAVLDQSEPVPAQLDPSWSYLGTVFGAAWGCLGLFVAILVTSWEQEPFRTPRPKIIVPQLKFSGVSS